MSITYSKCKCISQYNGIKDPLHWQFLYDRLCNFISENKNILQWQAFSCMQFHGKHWVAQHGAWRTIIQVHMMHWWQNMENLPEKLLKSHVRNWKQDLVKNRYAEPYIIFQSQFFWKIEMLKVHLLFIVASEKFFMHYPDKK